MSMQDAPILDPRSAEEILAALDARRGGYVPELKPGSQGIARALMEIDARLVNLVAGRVNRTPGRAKLAFLDLLGVGLIPSAPARAPVAFKPLPEAGDTRVGAGVRLGAQVPGSPDPIFFETEEPVAVAAARLIQVTSVWPAGDVITDHSLDLAGGRPFTLFASGKPVEHALYLAHEGFFTFAGGASVELEFTLATPSSKPLALLWEFWDGQAWRQFADFDRAATLRSIDGTAGMTRSGIVVLRVSCGESEKTRVGGCEAHWVRVRTAKPLPPDPESALPQVQRIRVRAAANRASVRTDNAFADASRLDLTQTFHPFGLQPRPGNAFYLGCRDLMTKPKSIATVTLAVEVPSTGSGGTALVPTIAWEYWNGRAWTALSVLGEAYKFQSGGNVEFTVPDDAAETSVNGVKAPWLRARIVSGGYGVVRSLTWKDPGGTTNTISVTQTVAPAVKTITISYRWRSGFEYPEQCLTDNDFQVADRTLPARTPGTPFPPFNPVSDTLPTLYLGFDKPLPNDIVGLFFDLERSVEAPQPLVWEAWTGESWRELTVEDDTNHLSKPGTVRFIPPQVLARPRAEMRRGEGKVIGLRDPLAAALFAPGDLVDLKYGDVAETATVAATRDGAVETTTPLKEIYPGGTLTRAALPRFGMPLDWVRVRPKQQGAPRRLTVLRIALNVTWAVQTFTITNETLGSGNGQPGQALFFVQRPVLEDERIEVRELDGPRAAVEFSMLRDELLAGGFTDDDIRTELNVQTGCIREVWVRWRAKPSLLFSGPTDRDYVIERSMGRIVFGDDRFGRMLTVGANNVCARQYRTGGGITGNVPAHAINQLLAGAPLVQSVNNPIAATGGADGETLDSVNRYGSAVLRHRYRALSTADFEQLARRASPAVAAARVAAATQPNGRPEPGWVTVIVVPYSDDAQPVPSEGLMRNVRQYIAARAPASLHPDRISIIQPTYFTVDVATRVRPRHPGSAGPVRALALDAIRAFLHPVHGGPRGEGWRFGEDVCLADLALALVSAPSIESVQTLDILVRGVPIGDRLDVPANQLVAAGTVIVDVTSGE
ncbi:baseplate J/gp47 family protein [Microvirga massiliensis]|uniref:baseplate J/gp47 family protein n=1 Tax=Microvirga massiliensis TaxID=1033741 RepID=UPI00062B59FD|nr:baseplate J/gp47 family protein [Microvirga massiliensis]